MTMQEKIQAFAKRLHDEYLAWYLITYPGTFVATHFTQVTVLPGRKYTKVDVGLSGKYMVVNETGQIFGIKAYGVIHRGHAYGTVDTLDDWKWGGYRATPKT